MDEYIEREALKAKFMEHYSSEYAAALVLALIDNQPTVDVAEVRHGKWKYFKWCDFKCSECGCISNSEPFKGKEKYCPHCGAKMDLEAVE